MTAAADLLVTGRVVTGDPARRVIADGAVAVTGGRIAAVGPRAEVLARHPAPRVIDRPGAIVLPGFVDAHTHVAQALVRGLVGGELPMIYRLYIPGVSVMSAEEVHTAATLCFSQLLESGVTLVSDGSTNTSPERVDAVIQAATEIGIRLNIVRGRGDQDFHHAPLYTQAQDRSSLKVRAGEAIQDLRLTQALLERYPARGTGLITAGVCASSVTNFSSDYFVEAARLAEAMDARLHIHASRDREEVEFCLAVHGRRPIEQLADLGVLTERVVIAHAMLATGSEIALLGAARAGVAHSPVECVNILNNVPDVPLMRALGARVGLGCDNAVNDIWIVMHTAWVLHGALRGIRDYHPDVLDPDAIVGMASREAAGVLGLDAVTGSLEVGKAADLVVLDGSSPFLRPSQHLTTELVRYGSRKEVRTVIVGGRVVVDEGRVVTIDVPAMIARAEPSAARLKTIIEPRRYKPLGP